MNEQMNILLEVLEEIKQQNRELKASISNLASQSIPTTTPSEEDGISLSDIARLIGQKMETDGKFKNELTDVAIVLGKRIREIKDGITEAQEKQAKNIASLSEKIREVQSPPEIKKYYLFDVKRRMVWLIWEYLLYSSAVLSVGLYTSAIPIRLSKATLSATVSYVWSKVAIVPQSPILTAYFPPKAPPIPFDNSSSKSPITNS